MSVANRLFLIWNSGYKIVGIVAPDFPSAIAFAYEQKHTRRRGMYRKFEDVTERALAGEALPELGVIENAEELLNSSERVILRP